MEHSEKILKFPQPDDCPNCSFDSICHNPDMQQRCGFNYCISTYWRYELDNEIWEGLKNILKESTND